jgi:hypothetical protein
MPEKLDTFEFTNHGSGGKYDWDTFLDGSIYKLVRGTDFEAKPSSFLTTVRKQADKRKMTVNSQIVDDNTLVIQAMPAPSE